jgi:hypothetical protein
MVSYSWGHQKVILRVVKALQDRGYNVWVDVEQMKGSTVRLRACHPSHPWCTGLHNCAVGKAPGHRAATISISHLLCFGRLPDQAPPPPARADNASSVRWTRWRLRWRRRR